MRSGGGKRIQHKLCTFCSGLRLRELLLSPHPCDLDLVYILRCFDLPLSPLFIHLPLMLLVIVLDDIVAMLQIMSTARSFLSIASGRRSNSSR